MCLKDTRETMWRKRGGARGGRALRSRAKAGILVLGTQDTEDRPMAEGLGREGVACVLAELEGAVVKEACWTCDCLQGLLTQLELDAGEDVDGLTGPLKVSREAMHGCLGCEPCPPGEVYSSYIRGSACCGGSCDGG